MTVSKTTLMMGLLLLACSRDAAPPAARVDSTVAVDSGPVSITVDGEGLRLFVIVSGAARPLAFDADSALVHEAIARVTKVEPTEAGIGGDCPGSFARWPNGLTLRYSRGKFVGWALRDGDSSVTTLSGIGVGTSRAEVENSLAIEVKNTSLGVEFTAGGLAGLFDGPGSGARVTNLWAGETCISR
jgi:hypothetical protein